MEVFFYLYLCFYEVEHDSRGRTDSILCSFHEEEESEFLLLEENLSNSEIVYRFIEAVGEYIAVKNEYLLYLSQIIESSSASKEKIRYQVLKNMIQENGEKLRTNELKRTLFADTEQESRHDNLK
ncbi:hypothetical protein ABWK39_16700 [Bacillus toyonensis]|uniref:hypothetical protein n=1 Tax=Bacillus toyonensis TaxID=155322 RepID=UPI000BF637D1|nr:hypothetical protein [Bacillus toyonensis]PGB05527.1 hypothetical protein COL96_27770 [Bacillus toyonensis]